MKDFSVKSLIETYGKRGFNSWCFVKFWWFSCDKLVTFYFTTSCKTFRLMRCQCCDLSLSAGKCIALQHLFHGEISCYQVPVRSLKGESSKNFFVDGNQNKSCFWPCVCELLWNEITHQNIVFSLLCVSRWKQRQTQSKTESKGKQRKTYICIWVE